MIFANVKNIAIPEGNVKQISRNGTVLWEQIAEDARLPLEYKEIEYIETKRENNTRPFIDTGLRFFGFPYWTIDYKIKFNELYNYNNMFGLFPTIDTACEIWVYSDGRYAVRVLGATDTSMFKCDTNTIYRIIHDNGRMVNKRLHTIVNDNFSKTLSSKAYPNESSKSFNVSYMSRGGGQHFVGRTYYLKMYAGETAESVDLVRDFVPCYRKSDNVIGLYDLVEGRFYTNAGTGTFLKGADV